MLFINYVLQVGWGGQKITEEGVGVWQKMTDDMQG